MSQITLYDIPSKGSKQISWSLNPWKTRMILNYKGLDYKTTWLEYPDIAPTFKSLNIPPNPPSSPRAYTCPAIHLPQKDTYIMSSDKIATALEETYPPPAYPSLHLDSPQLTEVTGTLTKILEPLIPVWMPFISKNLLNEVSAEYFERTRAERFGCSLTELNRRDGGEGAWKEAEAGLREIQEIFGRVEGDFVLGDIASYADFTVVSFLHCCKRIDQAIFERLVGAAPALGKVYGACGKWLERDDH